MRLRLWLLMRLVRVHERHLEAVMISDVGESALIQHNGVVGRVASQTLHYKRLDATLSQLTGLKCAKYAYNNYAVVCGGSG